MRLLATGAAGFLGRHVVRRLLADGLDVTTYDLVDTGHLDARSITGDLRDADTLSTSAIGHEIICHVGAIGDAYLAAEINVTGSANVAAAAQKAGARVIYSSTWAFSLASQTQAHGVALNTLAPESTTIRQLAEQVVARFPTVLTKVPFDRGLSELMDAIGAEG
ncbi:MAG TPA: NAD(P)-dependent oxidoreductase [Acidimicrobiia bacterium]|nr:NAD(P)-dependent oxidoreductase [Acidimicrobiia bacterium]